MASDPFDQRREWAWVFRLVRNVMTWAVALPVLCWGAWALSSQNEGQPPQYAMSKQLSHAAPVCAIAFSPDGRTIAAADYNGGVRVWDRESWRERPAPPKTAALPSIAFSPDGKVLAVASGGDSCVRFWTLDPVEERSVLDVGAYENVRVAFSPDGLLLAVLHGPAGTAELWEYPTGRKRVVLRGPQRGFNDLAFSPDGRLLVTAGRDGWLRLWETSSGREAGCIDTHAGPISAMAVSPDGSRLASSGYEDTTVRLWDVVSGRPKGTAGEPRGTVTSLAFSPAGVLFMANPAEGGIWSFDTVTDRNLTSQRDAAGGVRVMTVSPDGRQMATGGNDPTVRLWDVSRIVTDGESD